MEGEPLLLRASPGTVGIGAILDLRGLSPRMGAVEYVRNLEEGLIRTCGDLGIPCQRIAGLTGVWTQTPEPRKIAAIGVHISRGVTSHGFALNVTTDLDYFKLIVPCGIADKPVTAIEKEIETKHRPTPSMEEVMNLVYTNFGRVFRQQILWLASLDQLLHSGNQTQRDEASKKSPEADKIDIPLKVPRELREIHGESGDEIFLA